MKNLSTILVFVFVLAAQATWAQRALPDVSVMNPKNDNAVGMLSEYVEEGTNYVISFWASWCGPCEAEFNAWKDYGDHWKNNYNVKIIGLSIDDPGARVLAERQWRLRHWYGRLLFSVDGGEVSGAFGINGIPHSVVVNADGNIIHETTGFGPGSEVELNAFIEGTFMNVDTEEFGEEREKVDCYQDPSYVYVRSNKQLEQAVVQVFSIDGKLVASVDAQPYTSEVLIDKSTLPKNNLYIFHVATKDWRSSTKLFVD